MYLPLGLSGSTGQRLLGKIHLTAHYTGQSVSQLQPFHMPLAYSRFLLMGRSRIAKSVTDLPLGLSGSASQMLGEVHLTAHYTGQSMTARYTGQSLTATTYATSLWE